jgi:FAD-dependent urate hydroxylase
MNTNKQTNNTALVIGCGIGGPVVAMALQRVGIEAVIYEAHEQTADFAGSFLNTASNGLDALRAIDVHTQVLNHGFPTPRMVMWSGKGKRLGEVANGMALADGTTSITIRRASLHSALCDEAIRRGIRIEHGKRLADAESIPQGVIARFDDDTEARGKILIGADGIHSRVRQILDPAAPRPRYTNLLSLGGYAHGAILEPTPDTFHMIFGKRAFFGYTVRPSGEVYWFANLSWRDEPTRQQLSAIPVEDWKTRLLDLYAEDSGPATEILKRTGQELAAYPVYDLPTIPTWHRDSMVIIGDAAHATSPSSGQGASMAIEDAVVLAKCLRDLGEPERAFAAYEHLRRERVQRVVRYSARIGRSKTSGPLGRWLRDLVIPFALKHFANADAHAWLYCYHLDWNEKVELYARAA